MKQEVTLEEQLRAAYAAEEELYAKGLIQAEQIASALRKGEDASVLFPPLLATLDRVAEIEARHAEVKALWQKSSRVPSATFRSELERVATLIERMASVLHEAEKAATEKKRVLAPKLDSEILKRQMHQAYLRQRAAR